MRNHHRAQFYSFLFTNTMPLFPSLLCAIVIQQATCWPIAADVAPSHVNRKIHQTLPKTYDEPDERAYEETIYKSRISDWFSKNQQDEIIEDFKTEKNSAKQLYIEKEDGSDEDLEDQVVFSNFQPPKRIASPFWSPKWLQTSFPTLTMFNFQHWKDLSRPPQNESQIIDLYDANENKMMSNPIENVSTETDLKSEPSELNSHEELDLAKTFKNNGPQVSVEQINPDFLLALSSIQDDASNEHPYNNEQNQSNKNIIEATGISTSAPNILKSRILPQTKYKQEELQPALDHNKNLEVSNYNKTTNEKNNDTLTQIKEYFGISLDILAGSPQIEPKIIGGKSPQIEPKIIKVLSKEDKNTDNLDSKEIEDEVLSSAAEFEKSVVPLTVDAALLRESGTLATLPLIETYMKQPTQDATFTQQASAVGTVTTEASVIATTDVKLLPKNKSLDLSVNLKLADEGLFVSATKAPEVMPAKTNSSTIEEPHTLLSTTTDATKTIQDPILQPFTTQVSPLDENEKKIVQSETILGTELSQMSNVEVPVATLLSMTEQSAVIHTNKVMSPLESKKTSIPEFMASEMNEEKNNSELKREVLSKPEKPENLQKTKQLLDDAKQIPEPPVNELVIIPQTKASTSNKEQLPITKVEKFDDIKTDPSQNTKEALVTLSEVPKAVRTLTNDEKSKQPPAVGSPQTTRATINNSTAVQDKIIQKETPEINESINAQTNEATSIFQVTTLETPVNKQSTTAAEEESEEECEEEEEESEEEEEDEYDESQVVKTTITSPLALTATNIEQSSVAKAEGEMINEKVEQKTAQHLKIEKSENTLPSFINNTKTSKENNSAQTDQVIKQLTNNFELKQTEKEIKTNSDVLAETDVNKTNQARPMHPKILNSQVLSTETKNTENLNSKRSSESSSLKKESKPGKITAEKKIDSLSASNDPVAIKMNDSRVSDTSVTRKASQIKEITITLVKKSQKESKESSESSESSDSSESESYEDYAENSQSEEQEEGEGKIR